MGRKRVIDGSKKQHITIVLKENMIKNLKEYGKYNNLLQKLLDEYFKNNVNK